jgi:hypothetical protein
MVQNIIVIILIAAASFKVLHEVAKPLWQKKGSKVACGGCSQCELKKSLITNGQQ